MSFSQPPKTVHLEKFMVLLILKRLYISTIKTEMAPNLIDWAIMKLTFRLNEWVKLDNQATIFSNMLVFCRTLSSSFSLNEVRRSLFLWPSKLMGLNLGNLAWEYCELLIGAWKEGNQTLLCSTLTESQYDWRKIEPATMKENFIHFWCVESKFIVKN